MSLANQIIETAHSLDKHEVRLARALAASFTSLPGRSPLVEDLADRASMFLSGLPSIAQALPEAMRFRVEEQVMDGVRKMKRTPLATLLDAFDYARLPYPVTWIEWPRPSGGGIMGWLLEEQRGGETIRITKVLSIKTLGNGVPVCPDDLRYGVSRDGASTTALDLTGRQKEIAQQIAVEVLSLLLLLNSRSQLLEVEGVQMDLEKINRRRRIRGLPPKLTHQTIVFDISRILKQHGDGLSEDEAVALRSEALVRGHFKVRKTGVFWWSPYVRNRRPERDQGDHGHGRDRLVVLRRGDATVGPPRAMQGGGPADHV